MRHKVLYVIYIFICLELLSDLLLFLPSKYFPDLSDRIGSNPRIDWVKRHLGRPLSVGTSSHSFDLYDQTKGWGLKPNLRGVKVFGDKILSSNSKGIRGRREFPYQKESRKSRIIILGDSFTFGDGVSDDETYAYHLQNLLGDETEVLNLGIHGYGHDQMLLKLEEEGIKYAPDIVLLGFIADDMERNLTDFRSYAKPKFILKNGNLIPVTKTVPQPGQIMIREITKCHFFDLADLFIKKLKRHWFRESEEMEKQKTTTALLNEIKSVSESSGAKFFLVYLPMSDEIRNPRLSGAEKFALAYSAQYKVIYFNPKEALHENWEANKLAIDTGHYNPATHQEIGESIYRFILEHKLLNVK